MDSATTGTCRTCGNVFLVCRRPRGTTDEEAQLDISSKPPQTEQPLLINHYSREKKRNPLPSSRHELVSYLGSASCRVSSLGTKVNSTSNFVKITGKECWFNQCVRSGYQIQHPYMMYSQFFWCQTSCVCNLISYSSRWSDEQTISSCLGCKLNKWSLSNSLMS